MIRSYRDAEGGMVAQMTHLPNVRVGNIFSEVNLPLRPFEIEARPADLNASGR